MDKMSSKKKRQEKAKYTNGDGGPKCLSSSCVIHLYPGAVHGGSGELNSSRDSAVIGTHRYVLVENCLLEAGHGNIKRSHLAR